MIPDVDAAYIAGLFDGEGSIHFKRGIEKKKKHNGKPGYRLSNSMRINMEITMTDESVLIWVGLMMVLLTACTKYKFDGFDPATSVLKWVMTNDKN